METLTKNEVAETAKSFDVLASINMYRHDLQTVGHILPETRDRVYGEELSYISEGINRPLHTEFHLKKDKDQLLFFDQGRWRPYLGTLLKGLDTAKQEAAADPRKTFMLQRAADDLLVGYKLQDLKPGEKISWHSPFPDKEADLYGDELISSLGFQPKRRMGFLYQAEGTDKGIKLQTQSVDSSDHEAFEAAMLFGTAGGSLEDMCEAYDEALSLKQGGDFYAGRRSDETIPEENAWDTVVRHRDLIEDYFLKEIEAMANDLELPDKELELRKKRLTYGVWAALKSRLDSSTLSIMQSGEGYGAVQHEVGQAYSAAAARGEVLFGCGGSITGQNAMLSASSRDVHNAIFNGEKKWMSCPYCGVKQYGDPCVSILECGACQARVENGQVRSYGKVYRHKAAKGIIEIATEELAKWNQQYRVKELAKQETKFKELNT